MCFLIYWSIYVYMKLILFVKLRGSLILLVLLLGALSLFIRQFGSLIAGDLRWPLICRPRQNSPIGVQYIWFQDYQNISNQEFIKAERLIHKTMQHICCTTPNHASWKRQYICNMSQHYQNFTSSRWGRGAFVIPPYTKIPYQPIITPVGKLILGR